MKPAIMKPLRLQGSSDPQEGYAEILHRLLSLWRDSSGRRSPWTEIDQNPPVVVFTAKAQFQWTQIPH